jgi:hypothetical protein
LGDNGDRMSLEKRWYVRDRINGQPRQLWLFENHTATRIGVTNPETGAGTFFRALPGESFLDCLRRQTSWLDPSVTAGRFHCMSLGPGKFFPRIARPLVLAREPRLWSSIVPADKAFVASARSQLTLLTRKLENICQTVQPSERTLNVYGHEIRNLLILAVTEVEMHCRGILTANGAQASQFNTNQYVKLAEPLRLSDYAISFRDFPDLQPVQPFSGWSRADPTRSLPWYAAYNGVKHNREGEFESGTLQCAFQAVSACIALMVAQFGPTALNVELSSTVSLTFPDWPIGEMYVSPMTSPDWTPVNLPGLGV